MKLLVTGGAGFIGSNFIKYWLKKYPNDKIVNLDKLTYAGKLENLTEVENNPNYKFVQKDICDVNIDNVIGWDLPKDFDVIVNFAAESMVDRSIVSADEFIRTNVMGTHALLKFALKHKIRFHQIGTDEVFGSLALESTYRFHEYTSYEPHNPYSASKAAADHLVRAFHETYGLPITISNCSNNYGPNQDIEKMIPKAITNLLQGKKVPVYGDGLNVRDWLYVEDHCRAIDLILHDGMIGETYCIGGLTEDVNNIKLIKKILEIMGKGEDMIEFITDRKGHDRKYAIDFKKIQDKLGYYPQFNFNEYLTKTIDWYKNNKSWWTKK